MRGATLKKIDRFVDTLIINTKPEELTKTREELIKEMRLHWKTQGKAGQKFVSRVIDGSFFTEHK